MTLTLDLSPGANLELQLSGCVSKKTAARFDASLAAIHLLHGQQPPLMSAKEAERALKRLARSIQCAVNRWGARNS